MKLGILIPEFPTQTHVFFWREIEALSGMGVDVSILSTRPPREGCPHGFATKAVERTFYLYPPGRRALARLLSTPGSLRSGWGYLRPLTALAGGLPRRLIYLLCAAELSQFVEKEGIEHVHSHSCADAAHILAMSHSMCGISYSLHLHGDLPVYGGDHAHKMREARFVAAAARPMQRQLVEDVGLSSNRTCTLWMGVDTDFFVPIGPGAACEPAVDRGESAREMRVTTVGRLNPTKGHRFALEAVRGAINKGARIHYKIAGSGPHHEEIAAHIRSLDLEGCVELVGSRSETGVRSLLQETDVFVLSSFGEGEASPVAVMEAMSCGIPVIATTIGGVPDMIQDGVDGILVPQRDASALATALLRLHAQPGIRSRLGRAARIRAVEQFDSRQTARRFLDAVREHAHRPGGI